MKETPQGRQLIGHLFAAGEQTGMELPRIARAANSTSTATGALPLDGTAGNQAPTSIYGGGSIPPNVADGLAEHSGGGGDMLSRITRLEYGFCIGFLVIAGAAWALYGSLGGRIDRVEDRLGKVEVSVESLRGDVRRLDERTVRIETTADRMDDKLDRLLQR